MEIEAEELRESARRVLEKAADKRAPYADGAGAAPEDIWGTMVELGWTLLTTPEPMDGLGQSFSALVPIYQELGRVVTPAPFASSMAAVDVLAALDGSDAARGLLGAIGCGEARVAIVFADEGGVSVAGDGSVNGSLANVLDAGQATHLLLLSSGGAAIVERDAAGLSIAEVATWDRSRSLADVRFEGVRGTPIPAGDGVAIARAHLDLAIACDSIGGGDQCFAEAVEYMGTRQQFGRPIGSFQALKHRSADLKVALELARAFVDDAALAYATRRTGWQAIAAQAKLLAADAYRAIAEESVQFHGGVGFTWEYNSHLFLKRALLNEMLGGSPEQYRDRIAPDILRRAFAK